MAEELKREHVVVFPYMAQGHTKPLIDLSKALAKRGLKITIITTPSNSPPISQSTANHPLITLIQIPFPNVTNLPKGIENTIQLPSMAYFPTFLRATKQLKAPFDRALEEMAKCDDLPICVISDFFLGWTLRSCEAFGVPRLVFHGLGVLSMAIVKSAWVYAANFGNIESSQALSFDGINLPFVLTGADLPVGTASEFVDPFTQVVFEVAEDEVNSWGVIANSFSEFEGDYISSLESFYKKGTKAWCVGPLSLYGNDDKEPSSNTNRSHLETMMAWLDKLQTGPNSIIYVSFGTQAEVSDAQLDEVAYGLEASGVPFLWVVRSKSWNLPNELREKIQNRGIVVRKWVDQRGILAHSSIGGFLSHCGWNSVLESITCGVPILAWPLIAEQTLNAKFVAEGLGAGIRVQNYVVSDLDCSKDLVPRDAFCEGVKELIKGSKGGVAREKAKALGEIAKNAVVEGGSSHRTLGDLIDTLRHYKR